MKAYLPSEIEIDTKWGYINKITRLYQNDDDDDDDNDDGDGDDDNDDDDDDGSGGDGDDDDDDDEDDDAHLASYRPSLVSYSSVWFKNVYVK